ncbi:MAG: hypothetical protein JW829_07310 [Pirellulales bacterium]|nr:hypothetical protein [Pirellulales bacterium]
MMSICESPYGFEDGQIVSYRVTAERLEVIFEFWNEQRGTVLFEGLIGIHDAGAIGVTVGSVCEMKSSDFLASLVARHYEKPPEAVTWKLFRFLDVDDGAMLDVVADSCSFAGIEHAQGG